MYWIMYISTYSAIYWGFIFQSTVLSKGFILHPPPKYPQMYIQMVLYVGLGEKKEYKLISDIFMLSTKLQVWLSYIPVYT